jgi:hypothetical protein
MRAHIVVPLCLSLIACGPGAAPDADVAAAPGLTRDGFDPAVAPFEHDPGQFAAASEHYQARLAQAGGGTRHTKESVPDWSGIWENAPGNGFSLRPGEARTGRGYATATTMKLTPRYAAEYEMRMRWGEQGRDFDPITWCLPTGFPRWLVEPFLKEFKAAPDQVWLMNEPNNEIRRIYTDGRGHVPEEFAYPLWFGDSIGFWDGATLVIHTNNIKANLYQREQPAHSGALETVEEWTEIDEGLLEVKVSLYDPESLTEPFHFVRYYTTVDNPDRALRIFHWSCEENQPVIRTRDGGSTFGTLPSEDSYVDLTDPEVWLAFEEAEEAGLIAEFERRAGNAP